MINLEMKAEALVSCFDGLSGPEAQEVCELLQEKLLWRSINSIGRDQPYLSENVQCTRCKTMGAEVVPDPIEEMVHGRLRNNHLCLYCYESLAKEALPEGVPVGFPDVYWWWLRDYRQTGPLYGLPEEPNYWVHMIVPDVYFKLWRALNEC